MTMFPEASLGESEPMSCRRCRVSELEAFVAEWDLEVIDGSSRHLCCILVVNWSVSKPSAFLNILG